jgi:hypothetical protein
MSEEEEHKIWHGELFPMSALKPQRSAATSASCSFPFATRVEHRARDEDLVAASPLRGASAASARTIFPLPK